MSICTDCTKKKQLSKGGISCPEKCNYLIKLQSLGNQLLELSQKKKIEKICQSLNIKTNITIDDLRILVHEGLIEQEINTF